MNPRALILPMALTGLLLRAGATAQTVRVVNMIPATMSGETNQDSEPDITVNPNDPNQIVGSAFTPDPTGSLTSAPVFCSADGGNTWVVSSIVPSSNGMTGDITVALSRNNMLYAGILHGGSGLDMRLLRSGTCASASSMTQLAARLSEDQPYARVHTALGGPQVNDDHLYITHNNFNTAAKTANVEQSLNAAAGAPPAGLSALTMERRTPNPQDGPPVRPAIHPDGTVYVAYAQWLSYVGGIGTGNIVVVRDDDWGQGTPFYDNLTDPSDALPGRIVAGPVQWVWNSGSVFGQERLSNRVSIAVDPTDNRVVYVAWADRPTGVTGNTATLHVRRSGDGGANWSASDLLTIAGALNPQVAVNVRGDVGYLYQQLTGSGATQRWATHFRQSTNGGGSWSDIVLADVPATSPSFTFLPYIGDYAGLTAVGRDFYGIFSANNTPDMANFPNSVTYQRNADFTTHTLNDGSGGSVAVSIDPFFFHIRNLPVASDFYVRDWTQNATVHDPGLEPSTEPVFYATSDVWNRRSNSPAPFNASDQPVNETPHDQTLGTNFAFARVHRNAVGTAETVTLHFLVSEFGTGSNYQHAGTAADPTLTFTATDPVLTMTAGYPWTLPVTTSTHLCLAVEISTSSDQVVQPSLFGRAPGWPTTDLSVIYDNNKAQRNMGVYPATQLGGSTTYWAVVHNADTRYRNMVLDLQPDPAYTHLFGKPEVEIAGGRLQGDRLVVADMAPGESRWLGLRVPASPGQREGERASVAFSEMRGELPVNGFTIAVQRVPQEEAAVEGLRLLASNLFRMQAILHDPAAGALAEELRRQIPAERIDLETYAGLVRRYGVRYHALVDTVLRHAEGDRFGARRAADSLRSVLQQGSAERLYPLQWNLDHAMDALLTSIHKQRGDVADVAQNMRWQADLLQSLRAAARVPGSRELAELSARFDREYAAGRISVAQYPRAVEGSLPTLRRLDEQLQLGQGAVLRRMEASLSDAQALQRAHRELLLRLENLRREQRTQLGG